MVDFTWRVVAWLWRISGG